MLNTIILLEKLEELENIELQEKLWLFGDNKNISSFTEAICGLFDDANLGRAIETGYLKNNFSITLCQKVEQLNQAIDLIPDNVAPFEIIIHPKMKTIRALSKEVLELFRLELT